ncbi:MAG: S-ribosylhomocysteine lyase [Eubacteriaceae bacterium]|nr:S-ribosylhomocysteine lyase [Eubacteriaceae bacterium]
MENKNLAQISSFAVNHDALLKGVYLSRLDSYRGCEVATFDIRMKLPNKGSYLDTATAHAIEHLGATYLRSLEGFSERVVYFGPMGCRTGFYLAIFGNEPVRAIGEVLVGMFAFIAGFEGKIPGQSPIECGNYLDLSLSGAKAEAESYLNVLSSLSEANTNYPPLEGGGIRNAYQRI